MRTEDTEEKEEIVSVKISIENISDMNLLSLEDFLGEKYIGYDVEKNDDGYEIDLPKISNADLEELIGILKNKNIKFNIGK